MALNAAVVFEVRTGGNDTNGGGFKTGATGTDWTLQNAAQYAVADGVTAGTTTITSATANFGTDVVGNLIYVTGGTGSIVAAWYEITSRTNSTTIVVDRSTGLSAGTGATLNIGGALASLGQAAAIATVAGHIVYQKSGTYTIASASTNIATGCPSATTGTLYIGYNTTRTTSNTDSTHPLNQFGAVSTVSFWPGSTRYFVRNIDVDGTSQTTSKGLTAGTGIFQSCVFSNFTAGAVTNGFSGFLVGCSATGCSTTNVFGGGTFIGCEAYANTITGFNGVVAINCLSYDNTGASTDGFSGGIAFFNCVAYGNGRNGWNVGNGVTKTLINCIAETNTGTGYVIANGINLLLNAAATGNGGSGRISGLSVSDLDLGVTSYTGSAFTNAAAHDFSLNNTGGAGAALRALGFPGVFPRGTTTGYLDIGAAQHQDPASGGGGIRLAGKGGLAAGA